MADAMTLAKVPSEKISLFNKRLIEACNIQPVTDVSLIVVHGQPVVTLFSEMVEADQEDVDEAKEDDEEIELGELIPSEAPLIVQVCMLDCSSDEATGLTQQHTERLYQRAKGGVTKTLHATGSIFGFVEAPAPDKKAYYCEQTISYMLVASFAEEVEEDVANAAKADAQMAKDLQKKKP